MCLLQAKRFHQVKYLKKEKKIPNLVLNIELLICFLLGHLQILH